MPGKYNVLVVDERDLLREKIGGIISRGQNIRSVTLASNCEDARDMASENCPHLILFGFQNKLSTIREVYGNIRGTCPGTTIVFYVDELTAMYRASAADLGARIIETDRIPDEMPGIFDENPR